MRSASEVTSPTSCSTSRIVVPRGAQLADQVGELGALGGPQPRGRLVEQQQPRPARQRPGHLQPPLLAERQPVRRPRRPVAQADPLEALRGLRPDLPLLPPLLRAAAARPRRSPPGSGRALRPSRSPAATCPGTTARPGTRSRCPEPRPDVRRQPVDAACRPKADRAGVGPSVARDEVEQRRLAGAVGADDAAQLALGHVEVDVAVGVDAAEMLRHAGRCSACRPSSGSVVTRWNPVPGVSGPARPDGQCGRSVFEPPSEYGVAFRSPSCTTTMAMASVPMPPWSSSRRSRTARWA